MGEGGGLMDEDEMEMMKKLGIPTGFDSTKGKPVPGADVSGVKAVTKRQPRQYMNRRGGFNRPLPLERNRWYCFHKVRDFNSFSVSLGFIDFLLFCFVFEDFAGRIACLYIYCLLLQFD
jgi:hypothetical protein